MCKEKEDKERKQNGVFEVGIKEMRTKEWKREIANESSYLPEEENIQGEKKKKKRKQENESYTDRQ